MTDEKRWPASRRWQGLRLGRGRRPGDFFGYTVDHPSPRSDPRGVEFRDRRLLLLGLLVGQGLDDVLEMQLGATLKNDELTPDELREIVIFLTHYAGWPKGAKLNTQVETGIARDAKRRARDEPQPDESS
jgi:4-carboxymuconolactone decarboxylase